MSLRTGFAISVAVGAAGATNADFDGAYAPANRTLWDEAGGMVIQDDKTALLISGDIGYAGDTALTIEAVADGIMSFDWDYYSADSGLDGGGYVIDGKFVELANNHFWPWSGSISLPIPAGQGIGF
jgi:hypothetical protein